ncbi:MAG: hypothetical protein ACLFUB_18755, partial [Cyclobacteriaceae bacterium]
NILNPFLASNYSHSSLVECQEYNILNPFVVFLIDNTQYRMFWRGPSRMVQNAVMLLPGL